MSRAWRVPQHRRLRPCSSTTMCMKDAMMVTDTHSMTTALALPAPFAPKWKPTMSATHVACTTAAQHATTQLRCSSITHATTQLRCSTISTRRRSCAAAASRAVEHHAPQHAQHDREQEEHARHRHLSQRASPRRCARTTTRRSSRSSCRTSRRSTRARTRAARSAGRGPTACLPRARTGTRAPRASCSAPTRRT